MRCLLLLIVALSGLTACARTGGGSAGLIPDPALAAAIAAESGTAVESLTASDLERVVSLTVRPGELPVKSLRGIGKCRHLKSLVLMEQQVTDLRPVAELGELTGLNIEGNGLTSIDALEGMVLLEWLHIGRNQVSDIAALQTLPKLRLLNAQNNQIGTVAALAHCPDLADLNLRGNRLETLSGLEKCGSLQQVFVGGNPLKSLQPLVENPGFTLNDRLVIDEGQAAMLEGDINELKAKGVQIVMLAEKGGEKDGE